MTDTEPSVEELRRWSAKDLMGWYLQDQMVKIATSKECYGYFSKKGLIYYEDDWRPDDPTTGQIWMVVEKMLMDDWDFSMLMFAEGLRGCHFPKPIRDEAGFRAGRGKDYWVKWEGLNPCLSILKAAYQARRATKP